MTDDPIHNHPDMAWDMAVPDGWKLVPVEPTEAMVAAACNGEWIGHPEARQESIDRWRLSQRLAARNSYRAMLAAAPPPPNSKE